MHINIRVPLIRFIIYEYDLLAYPDIAEAFSHPVQRFSSTEIQGEAITYDVDGRSLITAEEYRVDPPKMSFYNCIANNNYTEPDPILPPDSLPESEEEPGPAYGCFGAFHEYSNYCEADSITHCGEHNRTCKSLVAHWSTGSCKSKSCYVSKCTNNLIKHIPPIFKART